MSDTANIISGGIENRMNPGQFGGDDDYIVFQDIDHSSVNAHTVGFRVVCEPTGASGHEIVAPMFTYNIYTSSLLNSVIEPEDKVGWVGIRGPYIRYCVMSEWSRQATNYVKVDFSSAANSFDISSLSYLSSANFTSGTPAYGIINYSTYQYPSALNYKTSTLALKNARYMTNTDLTDAGGHYMDNPAIGSEWNEVDLVGSAASSEDVVPMGFWAGNGESVAYLGSGNYDPPNMLYSLISAGKLYHSDMVSALPSGIDSYGRFYLNGNFGFSVAESTAFDWNAATETEYELWGDAPYLYMLTDKSSYYVIASGERSPGGEHSFYDTFVPSYRFAFTPGSSASMGLDIEYFGLKPVPVNIPETMSPAISGRINELTELSCIDLRGVTAIDDSLEDVWPRKTWPIVDENTAFSVNGSTLSFMTKINHLAESAGLFKSGRLYGFDKDTQTSAFNAVINPTVYKPLGYEELFDLETNQSPSTAIDGSIHGDVENLFSVTGLELKDLGYTEDELRYGIWWKRSDDTKLLASVGKYYVKDLVGANSVRVYYENTSEPVVVYSGENGFEINCLDSVGNQMTSFGLVYPSGSVNSMSFNAVSCITNHANFVPDAIRENSSVATYFANPSVVSGAAYFFGTDGIFDAIQTNRLATNFVDPYVGQNYQVIDAVWEDYDVAPDVDRSGLPAIGIPVTEEIEIKDSSIATWYMYIDQLATPTDSSVSLEILDCHGKTSEGVWIDYNLSDVTDVLYRDGEFFLPNGLAAASDGVDGIDDIVSFNSVSVVRLKLRYRLVSTMNDAMMRTGGYKVVLGYRISSMSGLHRDFIVGTAMLNPVDGKRKLDDPHMLVRGRSDFDVSVYGLTYGTSALASVLNDSCYVVANYDSTDYEKTSPSSATVVCAWGPDDLEVPESSASEMTVAGSPYFVGCSWVEEPTPGAANGVRVYRSYGAYHRIVESSAFNVDYGDAEFKLYGKIHWTGDQNSVYKVYKEYTDGESPAPKDYIVRSADSNNNDALSIYDISVSNKREIYCKCVSVDSEKSFFLRVGKNANFIPAPSSSDGVVKLDLLDADFDSGVANIFLTNSDVYSNEIPENYWTYDETHKDLMLSWYEIYGRIFVNFKDFESISVSVGSVVTGPRPTDGSNDVFYRVDKSKGFSAKVTCELDGEHSDGQGNSIELRAYQGRWGMKFIDSTGEVKWDTGKDNLITPMLSTVFTHSATYTLRSAKAYGVGFVKESTKGGKLVWYGTCPYSYNIKINGSVRKTVTVDGEDTSVGVEWSPIWCPAIPEAYLVNGVIKNGFDVVLVNGTNATYNEYSSYVVGLPNATKTVNASDWTPSHNFPASSYSGSDGFTVSFKGNLTREWGGSRIDGDNYPTAIVVGGVDYDENVTRVVGGYRPKYPNSRDKIMFAPNEWLVADTINDKFRMILENLDYLERNTKYYYAPPTDFIGYFGDYLVGDSRRQGYVMRNRVEIYRTYSKDTSIKDEYSMFQNCKSICVDATFAKSNTGGGETSNNLYCSFGDRILAMPIMGDYTGGGNVSTIYPKRVNEFITDVTRMMYSPQTGLLFCLSPNTHRVYMFEKKRYTTVDTPYYGEIGGYGGATAKNKFNHPSDMFVSSKTIDGSAADELWVCDSGNRVIKHYTIRGQWLSTIDISVIDESPKSVCVDYLDNVYVLTEHYLIRFDSSGYALGLTKLREEDGSPMLVRSQYNAGFVYILYSDHVAKYSSSGELVGNFAETDVLTYTSLCTSENADVYIATDRNILHYTDVLRIGSIAAMENAAAERWSYADIALNPNENIQDIVLNNSFQRMYDDIMMYGTCIFGSITDDRTVYDMSTEERKALIGSFDKEKIFVGVNELVTVNVLNRVFDRMCDMLDMMISLI